MTTHRDKEPDIICEFCRSHGALTARELALLSAAGRRERIRQWIIKSRSAEIQDQIDGIAQQLFEKEENEYRQFYDALSLEQIEDHRVHARRRARQRVDERIRYGAICIDQIDSFRQRVAYNEYREICDREWQSLVEGKASSPVIRGFQSFIRFFRRA